MAKRWEIVGGAGKGGVLVRQGQGLKSLECPERLSTGAIVEEVTLTGERLQYRLVNGTGPAEGWISLKVGGKDLAVPAAASSTPAVGINVPYKPLSVDTKPTRIWAISDIHTDQTGNLKWMQELSLSKYRDDILLLAGDVASDLPRLEETLTLVLKRFARVFFVPGNHDLWVHKDKDTNSLQKLQLVLDLCAKLGVETQAAVVEMGGDSGVLIVPLFSWYHSSFDTEPDLDGWDGVQPVTIMSDFTFTRWPAPLSMEDTSVAEQLDRHNDIAFPCKIRDSSPAVESFDALCMLPRDSIFATVISFSHFLPRKELFPERRMSNFPNLMKGIGSNLLGDRVKQLKPDCHIFGHTHYGWDCTIDGVRYIQAALGNVAERKRDPMRFSMDDFLAVPDNPAEPLLVFGDSGFLPRRRTCFATMYEFCERKPSITNMIAPWAQGGMTPTPGGPGCIGLGGQAPAWLFGIDSAKRRWVDTYIRTQAEKDRDTLQMISPQGLKKALDDPRTLPNFSGAPIVLDARPGEVMKMGHLHGAVAAGEPEKLAFGDLRKVADLFGKLNNDKLMKIVYTSAEFPGQDEIVARLLIGMAFSTASAWRLLQGGLEAWIQSGASILHTPAGC